MVTSMTGYGQVNQKLENSTITVEVKTVNHRFFDCSFKMPRELLVLEERMKRLVNQYIERGRVDIYININGDSLKEKQINVDWSILNQYIERVKEVKNSTSIQGDLQLDHLLQLDDVFSVEELSDFDTTLEEPILTAIEEALKRVLNMRMEEGSALHKDILMRIDQIDQHIQTLKEKKDTIQSYYQDKVIARLKESLQDYQVDEGRLLQEVALLVDKGDITEEVTRLHSHIEQMRELLELDEPIGRKLDFLTQELHRETNTIGSKSNDVNISKITVALKSEIEKIKEQVQNIE
ncbi:YicC/YloC family endoribonuclease [Alkalibacillus aidingensis]|uniref:YicC/YloC family endoribonuclease n=1 Tax=Alkalibacillus aidingensis TaxID=2747607 RepID=UPI0016608B04|nr:YicC/YloC family endoribonuclease [Alkalibacillus aidingensis]